MSQNPIVKESWIQEQIANDPSILGLGELVLKDKERNHPRAGRLDLLLQDPETKRRYVVEVQLGKTDESHIIRTIEYWDKERKRYPQYEHCAVIIAEDITSRFSNVINLFNGTIPLIAIQMNAYKFGEDIALVFTKVLDEVKLGLVDEDEEIRQETDRDYWLKRGTTETVKMADEMLDIIKEFNSALELKYNKFYIGLSKDGQPYNFVIFRPMKKVMGIELKLPQSEETQALIDEAGFDDMGYETRWNNFRLRLTKSEIKSKKEVLMKLLEDAYRNFK